MCRWRRAKSAGTSTTRPSSSCSRGSDTCSTASSARSPRSRRAARTVAARSSATGSRRTGGCSAAPAAPSTRASAGSATAPDSRNASAESHHPRHRGATHRGSSSPLFHGPTDGGPGAILATCRCAGASVGGSSGCGPLPTCASGRRSSISQCAPSRPSTSTAWSPGCRSAARERDVDVVLNVPAPDRQEHGAGPAHLDHLLA